MYELDNLELRRLELKALQERNEIEKRKVETMEKLTDEFSRFRETFRQKLF